MLRSGEERLVGVELPGFLMSNLLKILGSRFADEQQQFSSKSSPLCSSLTQLKAPGCLGLGEAGLRVAWKCLQKLQLLQAQETLIG